VLAKEQELGKDGSMKRFCTDKLMVNNAVIMVIIWTTCSFNYYLINFYLKYIPGDLF
jgi:hypothetical protein